MKRDLDLKNIPGSQQFVKRFYSNIYIFLYKNIKVQERKNNKHYILKVVFSKDTSGDIARNTALE